jgi:putative acetyltransferase
VNVPERIQRFTASIEAGTTIVIVADERSAIVGQLSLWLRDGRAYLGMMVSYAERGRGIGRALMERALREARTRGIPSIDLDVYGHNGAARALYASLGFVESAPAGSEERANGEVFDVIPMTRALDT